MSPFNPTLVPKSTLKTLAKRLGSHPALANSSASQRQEIIARTFGHSSWYTLCQAGRPATQATAADPNQRARLYRWLGECLGAGGNVLHAARWIAEAAEKAGDTSLRELAQALAEKIEEAGRAAEAFEEVIGPHAPIEAFLVGAGERQGTLALALSETYRMAKDLANAPRPSTNQGVPT